MKAWSLLCRTWHQCRSGTDSGSCYPASSNVSSAVKRATNTRLGGKHTWPTKFTFHEETYCTEFNTCQQLWRRSCLQATITQFFCWDFNGYQSYQVVPARVMNHPTLFHHSGAPPLCVLNGLDHPHQRDVAARGRTTHAHTTYKDSYAYWHYDIEFKPLTIGFIRTLCLVCLSLQNSWQEVTHYRNHNTCTAGVQ